MAAQSSNLAWRIPWTEEPDRLQSMGSQRVRQDRVTEHVSTNEKSSPELKPQCSCKAITTNMLFLLSSYFSIKIRMNKLLI